MSRRIYGMLAGALGSAIGFYLWNRQRGRTSPVTDRGTVIFHNTPTPSGLEL